MTEFQKADNYGRDKVITTLVTVLTPYLDNIEVTYTGIKDKEDIFIIGNNKKTNNIIKYCIECKDRKFEHTKYDNDEMKDEERGYIIEQHKKEYLITQSQYGMIPLYVNSFSDDYVVVWNLNKVDWDNCSTTGNKTFKEKTVVDSEKYVDNKQTLKLEQAQWIGKLI